MKRVFWGGMAVGKYNEIKYDSSRVNRRIRTYCINTQPQELFELMIKFVLFNTKHELNTGAIEYPSNCRYIEILSLLLEILYKNEKFDEEDKSELISLARIENKEIKQLAKGLLTYGENLETQNKEISLQKPHNSQAFFHQYNNDLRAEVVELKEGLKYAPNSVYIVINPMIDKKVVYDLAVTNSEGKLISEKKQEELICDQTNCGWVLELLDKSITAKDLNQHAMQLMIINALMSKGISRNHIEEKFDTYDKILHGYRVLCHRQYFGKDEFITKELFIESAKKLLKLLGEESQSPTQSRSEFGKILFCIILTAVFICIATSLIPIDDSMHITSQLSLAAAIFCFGVVLFFGNQFLDRPLEPGRLEKTAPINFFDVKEAVSKYNEVAKEKEKVTVDETLNILSRR